MPQDRPHEDVTTWLQPSIICGTLDALIPADHGLMGEERNSFNPEASAQGWQRLIEGIRPGGTPLWRR